MIETPSLTAVLAYIAAVWRRLDTKTDHAVWKAVAVVSSLFPGLEPEARRVGRALQTQTVIAGVVIGAALLIGFFVIAQISSALPHDVFTDSAGNTTDFGSNKNDTLDRIGEGLLIGGVIIIVLMAAIILRVLRGL